MISVDVVVPCYRYGQYLRECVASLLTQSVRDIRVLIINDASPDNTAEVAADLLKEDSRISYLQHATNKGHICTYNEGIEWASGDYLLLLSADDYLLSGALQRAVDLMERHPEVGLTFGNAIELDAQGRQRPTDCLVCEDGERILAGSDFIALSGSQNIVPTPTAVVRTALQKTIGGYRKELPHTGDMELWLRLAAHSSVGFVPHCQAVYRRHSANMSLAYTAELDLMQRKEALDWFLRECRAMLPEAEQLGSALYRTLALDAVSFASGAFDSGNPAGSQRLTELALQICPVISKSLPWVKLACKRFLGPRAWRVVLPAAIETRKTVRYLSRMDKRVLDRGDPSLLCERNRQRGTRTLHKTTTS